MKDVAVSQSTFSTNGHTVSYKLNKWKRLRPTYSVCKIPYVVSWCSFLLSGLSITSCSADINERSLIVGTPAIFFMVWGEALREINQTIILYRMFLLAQNL